MCTPIMPTNRVLFSSTDDHDTGRKYTSSNVETGKPNHEINNGAI